MRAELDVIVVGGGAMGSATAWQLARRGRSVRLLERFTPGHHLGASHGATRNFNTAYAQDDYLDLVTEARILWDELAQERGTTLLDLVGLVNHGDVARLHAVADAHAAHGIRSGFVSASEAMDRWQGMRFSGDVLLVPGSGRVRAADALVALRGSAESAGARFSYETSVQDIRVVGDDHVIVVTDTEEIAARRVVVTAGAWTAALLGDRVALPRLVVTQESPAHFQPRRASDVWPSFNHTPEPGNARDAYWPSPTYGMLTPGEGVKTGWHGVGPVVDPDARDFLPHEEQFAALARYAEEWLPGVDATTAEPISCTYTTTPTEDFVLDRVGPIVVGAGFSGHGFKFTPAIGRVLADLVDGHPAPARFATLGR